MTKDIKSAYKVRGCLIKVLGEVMFRVYDSKDKTKFTDYEIFHNDLEVQIIDFMSILVNDSYTELFRMISLGIVVGTSVIMMSSNDMWISKIISMTFVSVFYMYRLSQEYRTQKRNTSSN